MNSFRFGYRESQAARPNPIKAPASVAEMHAASKVCIIIAFVLIIFVLVYGCMAGL